MASARQKKGLAVCRAPRPFVIKSHKLWLLLIYINLY